VLLVAVYYRTNLTLRQIAPVFGVSKSAAGRVVDHLGPYLAVSPVRRRHRRDTVLDRRWQPGAHPRPRRVGIQ
jgi:hypothetical protein